MTIIDCDDVYPVVFQNTLECVFPSGIGNKNVAVWKKICWLNVFLSCLKADRQRNL